MNGVQIPMDAGNEAVPADLCRERDNSTETLQKR